MIIPTYNILEIRQDMLHNTPEQTHDTSTCNYTCHPFPLCCTQAMWGFFCTEICTSSGTVINLANHQVGPLKSIKGDLFFLDMYLFLIRSLISSSIILFYLFQRSISYQTPTSTSRALCFGFQLQQILSQFFSAFITCSLSCYNKCLNTNLLLLYIQN